MAVQVRCTCGYRADLPDEWAGKQGRCPQCQKVLEIPGPRARPKPAAARPVQPVESAEPEAPLTDAAEPAKPAASGTARLVWLRNPVWLGAVGGGVLLLVIGLVLLLHGNAPVEPEQDQIAAVGDSADQTAGTSKKGTDVFRPAVRQTDPGIELPAPIELPAASKPRVLASPDRPATQGPQRPATAGASPAVLSLRDHGTEIPSAAAVIEIDGVAIPVKEPEELVGQGGTTLVLPMGKHVVRFARTGPPQVVEPKRWFLDAYREAAAQAQENGRWSFDRLLELSRGTLDRFTEPLVPHFWGNYYWQERAHDAAARQYAWALEIAPTFAPAYFNLAGLAHERGDDDAARRYLRLADLWNVQNAYGLALASSRLRVALGPDEPTVSEDEPDWFVPDHGELTARDRDMTAVLRSAAEFAPRLTERAKILNNLGAYFEHVGKPELALEHYRSAAAAFGSAPLGPEERRIIHAVLVNLARVCRKADMPEYQRYERMQAMVQP